MLGVEHQVEGFGRGFGAAEAGAALGFAIAASSSAEEAFGGGAFQVMIEHQVPDAARAGGDDAGA